MVRLTVHVTPKSSQNAVTGWRGAELAVRVTAAPEGGKANAAVERTVAEALGVAKSAVRVVRGGTARTKTLEIDGVEEARLRETFGGPDRPLW